MRKKSTLYVKMLDSRAKVPTYHSEGAAGLDLHALEPGSVWPLERSVVRTGLAVEIPPGYVGIIKARSGLAVKSGIEVGAGVIDSDYRGEVHVLLHNFNKEGIPFKFEATERIAQLGIFPCFMPTEIRAAPYLPETDRGTNGFGSTGK